jgi:hypothetical protein
MDQRSVPPSPMSPGSTCTPSKAAPTAVRSL